MHSLQLVFICRLILIIGNCQAWDDYHVLDFLRDIKRLHGMDTILLALNGNVTEIEKSFLIHKNEVIDFPIETEQFVQDLMSDLKVPVVQMNELSPAMYLKGIHKDSILAVVYFDGSMADHKGLLEKLLVNLKHMTLSKTLFLIKRDQEDFDLLKNLFMWCWQSKFLNVVALFSNYQSSETFYSYTHFPEFHIETKRIFIDHFNRKDIYPYRLSDLNGYKLPYIVGGSDPRIIVYPNKKGNVVVGGFVGHFLTTFAKKRNCYLVEPLPSKLNNFAPSQELIAAVRNGTVEISAGITFPQIPFIGYTYPYEQMNWCIMLPVESDIPAYKYYTAVFEVSAFLITLGIMVLISMTLSAAVLFYGYHPRLIDFVMHENCFRGVLGQPFIEIVNSPNIIRFVYLQICMMGILMTTSFNSYFSTYVTSAPKEPELRTFDEILASGLMLYAWEPEYNELLGRVKEFAKYAPMFYRESSFQQYLKMRDSLNPIYGYLVPTTKWTIVNEQQKIFTTPLFRRREDLCFFNNIPMCFPVHENSIFKEILYEMILAIAEAGLSSYWRQIGFIESIEADKMTFADLSSKKEFEAMKADTLIYIWYGYAIMVALSTLVFCGELALYHRRKVKHCVTHLLNKRWK